MNENFEDKEIFAVYKPVGPSSFAMISRLRKILNKKKIGHAGTLDPLASGVLVIGVGPGTKKLGQLEKTEKEYLADIKLGEGSTTDDEEGEKTKFKVTNKPNEKDIEEVIKNYIGEISQTPPIYSALKMKGQPAYKLARRGEAPKMKERNVLIKNIEIISYKWPKLKIKVTTGPGVYIRALARDIGKDLGVGGYLSGLERTRVGEFTIDEAHKIL